MIILFSFFLPLVLCLVILVSYVGEKVLLVARSHQICRKELFHVQKRFSFFLTNLMKLNKKAASLRKEKKKADKALKLALMSKVPHLIAAAKAYQKTVIARQVLLSFRQKKITAQSFLWSYRTRRKIRKRFEQEFGKKLKGLKIPYYSLKVKKNPKKSLTPSYHPVSRFEQRQKIKLKWVLKQALSTPSSLRRSHLFQIKGFCSATLKKEGLLWKPALAKDKYS